jgi:tRNA-2-methylthio-N6-dimethylallyladenosine synthase
MKAMYMNKDTKKVFIKNFGCQMNARDSEVIKGLLVAEGYKLTDDPKRADVVLFNTCSVREHAEERVWSTIGKFKKIGKQVNRPTIKPIIGVIGCMAQNYKKDILKRAPNVDIVCGPSEIDNIALYLEEAIRNKVQVVAVSERKRKDAIYHTGFYEKKDHAYIVISEGCDNYCTYCVVPYVRGRLAHRAPQDILREAREAVACGLKNITLLGQNVNSYKSQVTSHKLQVGFVELLKNVSEIDGIKSLSFLTSHPKDVTEELFELMAQKPVIKKCLHMPLQSGSDRILKLMNRGYSAGKYLKLVDQYRTSVYNGQLSTDIIVGFPGETEEDFRKTREFLENIRFDSAYIFKYSPRPNTKASLMPDDVPRQEKERRHADLLNLQKEISKKRGQQSDDK